jgi:CBS domain-containing protein
MSRTPVTVSPSDSLKKVAHLMEGERIRHVVVVDGGCPTGIVSHRDVRVPPGSGERELSPASPVSQVMTEGPVTVSPDVALTEAVRVMLDRKIGALPVVEGDGLVGILTRADALEALLAWAEHDLEGA